MNLHEIVRMRINIALALFALQHVEERYQCGDLQVAQEALQECRDILENWINAQDKNEPSPEAK